MKNDEIDHRSPESLEMAKSFFQNSAIENLKLCFCATRENRSRIYKFLQQWKYISVTPRLHPCIFCKAAKSNLMVPHLSQNISSLRKLVSNMPFPNAKFIYNNDL